jgi:hypothetical protein
MACEQVELLSSAAGLMTGSRHPVDRSTPLACLRIDCLLHVRWLGVWYDPNFGERFVERPSALLIDARLRVVERVSGDHVLIRLTVMGSTRGVSS